MRRSTLTGLVVAAVAVVAVAVTVPSVLGRHDGDPQPGITDYGPLPGARDAVLVRVAVSHPVTSPDDPGGLARVIRPEQDFAFDLLSTLGRSGRNTTVSPASLAIALGMLQLGARGRTAAEIAASMHTDKLSAASQGQAWHDLTAAWTAAARHDGLDLETANSLWQQSGLQLPRAYLAQLADYFDTGVWQTDFRNHLPAAVSAVNRWTSEHTHGRITKLFADGRLDNQTRLMLANTVYFKADWQDPFDSRATSGGTFTRADGTRSQARFMHAERYLRGVTTSTYEAVELPYRGGRFSALAIMPTKGTLAAFTASLDAAGLAAITGNLRPGEVELALPRFETSSVSDLNGALRQLGMRTAFTDRADLSGIGRDLHVQQVVQRTFLKVAEKGTEAAAVTGIDVVAGAMPARLSRITFDHPFLFLVRDNATGALLFTSQIENPAA